MNWRAVFAIAQKDIMDAIKNLYVLFGLILPIGMSLLFRLIFPTQNDLSNLNIAVYDPGGSRLIASLRAVPHVKILDVASEDQMQSEVENKAAGGLVVPDGFDAAIGAGERPQLTVYLNRRRGGGELAAFRQLVEQQVWRLIAQEPPARIDWQDIAAPTGSLAGSEFRIDRYLLVMLLVMALSMAGVFAVPLLLVEEKEKHTLEALLVSPAGPAEVVAGKALAGMFYCLLTAGILLTLNNGWVGNVPLTVVDVLLGSLLVVAIGLLMGSAFRTTHQVNTWSSITMLVLLMPSWVGVLGPANPLDPAFHLIPTHSFSRVLDITMAGNASLAGIGGQLAILAGWVIVAYIAVVWILRRTTR